MTEITCLSCDKPLKLPQFIDTDNYDGQIVCQECKSLLHVKLIKGKVGKYKIVERLRKGEPVTIRVVYDKDQKQQ